MSAVWHNENLWLNLYNSVNMLESIESYILNLWIMWLIRF